MIPLPSIKERWSKLANRPDFQQSPAKALWRRCLWHSRWKIFTKPWDLTISNGTNLTVHHGGSAALIYYQGASEPQTNQAILALLQPGWRFWDVGAHIGEHSVLAARAVGEQGEVHAFEPNPSMYTLLQTNLQQNGFSNFVVNQLAVSDTSTEGEFEVFAEPAISRLKTELLSGHENVLRAIPVQCTTLDEYSQAHSLPHLIKIDVEGAELSVLRGMRNLLAKEVLEAPILIFEFAQFNTKQFGYDSRLLLTFLERFGYTIYKYIDSRCVMVSSKDPDLDAPENNFIASKSKPCLSSE